MCEVNLDGLRPFNQWELLDCNGHGQAFGLVCEVALTLPSTHSFPATRYGNMSMFYKKYYIADFAIYGLGSQHFLTTLLTLQLMGLPGRTMKFKQFRWRTPSIPSVQRMSFVQATRSHLPWMDEDKYFTCTWNCTWNPGGFEVGGIHDRCEYANSSIVDEGARFKIGVSVRVGSLSTRFYWKCRFYPVVFMFPLEYDERERPTWKLTLSPLPGSWLDNFVAFCINSFIVDEGAMVKTHPL